MESFEHLFRHNAWANERVLAAFASAPAAVQDAKPASGEATLLGQIAHLGETEEAFNLVVRGTPDWPHPPATLDEVRAYVARGDAALIDFAADLSEATASELRHVPWFGRDITVADCLRQVLGHSTQHRAEVAWELARGGVDTGELDYIMWLVAQDSP